MPKPSLQVRPKLAQAGAIMNRKLNMKLALVSFANIMFFVAVAAYADEPKGQSQANSPSATLGESKEGRPQFNSDGEMLAPKNYREWIFVGSSLGLGYQKTDKPNLGAFSHIYINPFGYRTFRETGKFPVGTVLMLEVVSRGEKTNPALTGYFSNNFIGLEAAVKTGDRFEDVWTYYNFFSDRKYKTKAKRLTSKSCITCHKKHAKTDHVFTQFYPVLRAVKPKD